MKPEVFPEAGHTCSSLEECQEFVHAVEGIVAGLHSRLVSTPVIDGEFCDIPGTCGPLLWELWHRSAEAFRDKVCEACGGVAVSLMRGFHDMVNLHLGKPVFAQEDLERFLHMVKTESTKRPEKSRMHQALKSLTYPTGENTPPTIIREQEEGPGLAGVIPPELAEYKTELGYIPVFSKPQLGNTTKEVGTRDPGLLVYQVTLPGMDESELVLKPQLTKREMDERIKRPSADLQPALFQAEVSRLLPIIEEALVELEEDNEPWYA